MKTRIIEFNSIHSGRGTGMILDKVLVDGARGPVTKYLVLRSDDVGGTCLIYPDCIIRIMPL